MNYVRQICACISIYTDAVIVNVGKVNGQMLWWLVWLANRVNETLKTRVDTGEITYRHLSMCIDAVYRNSVMYAEPQWGGCRSACKLLVELCSYKKDGCLLRPCSYLKNNIPISQSDFLSAIWNINFSMQRLYYVGVTFMRAIINPISNLLVTC
jgi:hypothetical protein